MTRVAPPSGKQYGLRLGDATAVVTEVGAGLRSYCVDGLELLDGYDVDQMCTGARGHVFIPWPNRIADGSYRFGEEEHQLPLSEPGAHNAIHGLTRWVDWQLAGATGHGVRLRHALRAQPGYPFALQCQVEYRLQATGLAVETRVTNIGAGACPYATGAHPYISPGAGPVDDLEVTLPAGCYYPTDDRGIPTGRRSVEGTHYDLRSAARLGDVVLDTAFTDLDRDQDGGCSVDIRRPDGRALSVWLGPAYRYVELFTGDTLPDPARRRRGLGVEPMTAAPNAFRTGDGLLVLAPGESAVATWELRRGDR